MKVLIADSVGEEGVALLRNCAEVDIKTGLKPEELIAIIGNYDALVVRSQTRVTSKVIEAGKNLQVIGRAGVGVDNIDVEAATRFGIVVVNAPSSNTISAAEHTIALMLPSPAIFPGRTPRSKPGNGNAMNSPASKSETRPWASSAWAMSARRSPGVPRVWR